MTRAEVIQRLRDCADDPMWADHAEVSKRTLRAAIALLEEVATSPCAEGERGTANQEGGA